MVAALHEWWLLCIFLGRLVWNHDGIITFIIDVQHYDDVKWPSCCLELPSNRVFVEKFLQTDNNGGELIDDRWIPHKKITVTRQILFLFDDIIMIPIFCLNLLCHRKFLDAHLILIPWFSIYPTFPKQDSKWNEAMFKVIMINRKEGKTNPYSPPRF